MGQRRSSRLQLTQPTARETVIATVTVTLLHCRQRRVTLGATPAGSKRPRRGWSDDEVEIVGDKDKSSSGGESSCVACRLTPLVQCDVCFRHTRWRCAL